MSEKLNIKNEMRCFDSKDRGFYDSLTDEERKKFSNYLMIRWGSSIEGRRDLQEYYLISCNERFNTHFFDINKTATVKTTKKMICFSFYFNDLVVASQYSIICSLWLRWWFYWKNQNRLEISGNFFREKRAVGAKKGFSERDVCPIF